MSGNREPINLAKLYPAPGGSASRPRQRAWRPAFIAWARWRLAPDLLDHRGVHRSRSEDRGGERRNLGTALAAIGVTWGDVVRRTIHTHRALPNSRSSSAATCMFEVSSDHPPQTVSPALRGLAPPGLSHRVFVLHRFRWPRSRRRSSRPTPSFPTLAASSGGESTFTRLWTEFPTLERKRQPSVGFLGQDPDGGADCARSSAAATS